MKRKVTTTPLGLLIPVTLWAFLFTLSSFTYAQTDTEFWFVAPDVTAGHGAGGGYNGGEPIYLRLSTLDLPSAVTISQPANAGFTPITLNIPASTSSSVDLTPYVNVVENKPANTVLNYGLHITSTTLITVYYEVNTGYNPDIFALKGNNALGTEFFTPFQNFWDNGNYNPKPYSAFNIVATEDNTAITITPTANLVGHAAGVPFTITLNKGQTWSGTATSQAAAGHPAGTKITSDKPIAVTISDDSMAKDGCRDIMGDQLVPTDIIGTEYIIMKGQIDHTPPPVGDGERVFVLATQDNTDIIVDGVVSATLDEGETYGALLLNPSMYVLATKPVYLLHLSGFQCELGGAVLPPVNICTGSTQVGFTRSNNQWFGMNVMVRQGAEDAFILNGNGPNTVINAAAFTPIPGTPWSAAQFDLDGTVPVNTASLIKNTKDLFHMGIINGKASTGCKYGYFSDYNALKIDAIIAGTNTPVIKICYGDTAQLIAKGGLTYRWSPTTDLSDPNISNPSTSTTKDIKYTVVVSGLCSMLDSSSVTVNVSDPLKADFDVENVYGCAPYGMQVTNVSAGALDYFWDMGNGDTLTTRGDSVFIITYDNATGAPVQYDLMLVARNKFACTDTVWKTITVFPEINAVYSFFPREGCNPLFVQYADSSTGADVYKWEFGDGGSSSVPSPSHLYQNMSTSDTTYPARLIVQSNYLCEDTLKADITVYGYLDANFTFDYSVGCTPFTVAMHNASVGGAEYFWNFGDGRTLTTTHDSAVTMTYVNATTVIQTYQISLVVRNARNCYDTIRRTLTVHPTVTADFTADTIGCHPFDNAFTDVSVGANTYKWTFGDGGSSTAKNPAHTFANISGQDTTYGVQLIASSGGYCADTATMDVSVYKYLNANYTFDNSSSCTPFAVTVTNSSVGADFYQWDFGNGDALYTTIDSSIRLTYNNPSDSLLLYAIQLIAGNGDGCSDTLVRLLNVHSSVKAAFGGDTIGCHPFTVPFADSSTGADYYSWDFGDGGSANATSPEHTFANLSDSNRVFTVQLVASSEGLCSDTATLNVTVFPYLEPNFTFDKSAGCTPVQVTIANASVGALYYHWNFDDGSTLYSDNDSDLVYTFFNTTDSIKTYDIRLSVQNGVDCFLDLTRRVTVHPDVVASFSGDTIGCNPFTVVFADSSYGASTYLWDFGDGGSSIQPAPAHKFQNLTTHDTTYTVRLIASSGGFCADTATLGVKVFPYLDAVFTLNENNGCTPFAVSTASSSIGADVFYWDFGNGDTLIRYDSSTVTSVYVNPTDSSLRFPVTLVIVNADNCTDSLTRWITVHPNVIAGFTVSDTLGCHPLKVVVTDTTFGADNYVWDFGDGGSSNIREPDHIFQNPSSKDTLYTIRLIASSGGFCGDTAYHPVGVYPFLEANFTFEYSTGCAPFTVNMTNASIGADDYYWDFGNNDTVHTMLDTAAHRTYPNTTDGPLAYPVSLVVENSNNCFDTLVRQVNVLPEVQAAFDINDTISCQPFPARFTNQSTGATTYTWEFGDGGSSNAFDTTHLYENLSLRDTTYNVLLVASVGGFCNDTARGAVSLYGYLESDYAVESFTGCSPYALTVDNKSLGAKRYYWNFGEGTLVTKTNMNDTTITYGNDTTLPVNYQISMVALSDNCSDTLVRDITVYPAIEANISADTLSGCNPLKVQFIDSSHGVAGYHWELGDGSMSVIPEPKFTFYNTSDTTRLFDISLRATSAYGCRDTATLSARVFPGPNALFSLDTAVGCAPLKADFTNLSQQAVAYRWDFGDGDTLVNTTTSNVSHIFRNQQSVAKVYNVELKATSDNGCTDIHQQNMTIYREVLAAFTVDTAGCSPLSASFGNTSNSASTFFSWNFGDGSTSTQKNPLHAYVNTSVNIVTYTSRLITRSTIGCRDTAEIDITVYPSPDADFLLTPDTVYYPDLFVGFSNLSGPGTWSYTWDYSDGQVSTLKNPGAHEFPQWGIYPVQLKVFSTHCRDSITKTVVIIMPPPIAAYSADTTGGCVPLTVRFRNESIYDASYVWDFGDGNFSALENPDHAYLKAGDYSVKLVVKGPAGEKDSIRNMTVHVDGLPTAYFDVRPKHVYLPSQPVQCLNYSQGGSSYVWSFGEGGSSTEFEPLYYYRQEGIYDVSLLVRTEVGCVDSMTLEELVHVDKENKIKFPDAFTPNTAGPTGGSYDVNEVNNDVFYPLSRGVASFHLMIFNRWGELIFETNDINTGWDGYYRNELCKQDVYIWKAHGKFADGQLFNFTGDVTLVR